MEVWHGGINHIKLETCMGWWDGREIARNQWRTRGPHKMTTHKIWEGERKPATEGRAARVHGMTAHKKWDTGRVGRMGETTSKIEYLHRMVRMHSIRD